MPPSVVKKSNDDDNMKKSMQYFIPTAELEQLQASIDIVSLVELYDLPHFHKTNGGERASCQCPFHDDTNPSLKIDSKRGIFKCFSCGVGGNAFKFVQEYSKLHGHHKLSFIETVRLLQHLVAPASSETESNQPSLPFDIKVPMGNRPPASISARVRKKVRQVRSTAGTIALGNRTDETNLSAAENQMQTDYRKQRILLANLHAAAFYEECLFSLPAAGSARAHLRSRGINPHTVKTFAMGFAPESYYTVQLKKNTAGPARPTWGEGSLVNHLRDRGFTPGEILDAGLAVQTKWGKRSVADPSRESNNTDGDGPTHPNDNDYSTLMDRFRGRLVIPIFDAAGNNILGFGGRILEASISTGSDFKAAKYLNSPESLVFQKKNILFGQHMAEKAARFGRSAGATKQMDGETSLLIVEGYMDAIALWQAGMRETVASMGTALSYEQLANAAKASRKLNNNGM
jgi:DNA primase